METTKEQRNQFIVILHHFGRISFGELAKFYGIKKQTVHEIFVRDKKKYLKRKRKIVRGVIHSRAIDAKKVKA